MEFCPWTVLKKCKKRVNAAAESLFVSKKTGDESSSSPQTVKKAESQLFDFFARSGSLSIKSTS